MFIFLRARCPKKYFRYLYFKQFPTQLFVQHNFDPTISSIYVI